jgi:hypothetical protein
LHWANQNHCQKIAESGALALGLLKPMPENCRERRPCTGLTKITARKCHELRPCIGPKMGLPRPLPENCREWCPCTGLTQTASRKLPTAAPLHWAYQNHRQKIAESCALALGLLKPMPEIAEGCVLACSWCTQTTARKCHELRPCIRLTKTTARKLPRVASLHWAHQNQCQKIAESCVLVLGLPKLLPEN